MRLAVVVLALAGCVSSYEASDRGDDTAPFAVCAVDADCVLAGPSCCDCPTYAVTRDSGWADSCADVGCTPPTDGSCAPLAARCVEGACAAACEPTACDLSCPAGFVVDAAGCVACMCATTSAPPACALDTDCVQVPADCCGCARGGVDVAVPRSDAETYVDLLGCPTDGTVVPCPEVSTCDPTAVPTCVFGQCQLAVSGSPPPTLPPGACGRPDLPSCPDGTACVLNQDPNAGPLGVGVCTPSMP